MEIYNLHGSQSLNGPHFRSNTGRTATAEAPKSRPSAQDSVQFSDAAQKMGETSNTQPAMAGIRLDMVNRIKSEIAAGTYDTPERMDAAIEKMLASF